MKNLEGESNIFLLGIEWFILDCLLRDTEISDTRVQRHSKHNSSVSSGIHGIFGYIISTHHSTLPDMLEDISHVMREGLHIPSAQGQMETEGT